MHSLIRSRLPSLHFYIHPRLTGPKCRANTWITTTLARSLSVPSHRANCPHWSRQHFARQLHPVGSTARVMASATTAEHTHLNRLAQEESPYLLQHQHNPVDWYPWATEAFDKAKKEDKPIFLSIGYSTCHWCHVMERESFEDQSTADILNESFVSIKVDREERPDVDKVYMTYVQATQGGGGWPMSVFLTPSLQPFVAGTYFPPQDMYGRPGFKTLLRRITTAWQSKKEDIKEQSIDTMEQLVNLSVLEGGRESLSDEQARKAIDSCAQMLISRYDEERGGFGSAPKFPRPSELNLLMVKHIRAKAAGNKAEMAAGGMYDQVGGGFHRYSVDDFWHIPHFEKMLYDNPQLACTYLDAFALTGDQEFARVARGILDYLRRDMTHPQGGVFSAEDADSEDKQGKKAEGAFYMWTEEEVKEVLGLQADLFMAHYYIKPGGNADLSPKSDPHHEFEGLNCLRQAQTLQQTAKQAKASEEEARQMLASCREKLHQRRVQRPRPHLDDKVVAGWNGMAIQAFAQASLVLGSEATPEPRGFPIEGCKPDEYLQAALQAATFVREQLWDESSQRLRRSFCRKPSAVQGFADDYSYLISGLLALFSATGDTQWLQWSQQLQATLDELFWDDASGGYFGAAGDDPSILMRAKEDYDGAEPAASSIAATNLFKLAALVSGEAGQRYRERAQKTAAAFTQRLQEAALALPQMCCALYLQALGHPRQVIIAGSPDAAETQALLAAAHAAYAPDRVVVPIDPSNKASTEWYKQHNPEAHSMVEGASKEAQAVARAFVCQNFMCKAPTTSPDDLKMLLQELVGVQPITPTLSKIDPAQLKSSKP